VPVFGSVIATELVARVIAARSPVIARRASLTAGALYVTMGMIPVFVGLLGAALVPALGVTLTDAEQLVPALAERLLSPIGFALFAGGLISAILSTVDSTLLVASGLLSHNLLVPLLGVRDERHKLRLARLGVLAFGALACGLALRADGVFALVEQASAFGSAGILVCVGFALFGGWGGPRTASATLGIGVVAYLGGQQAGVTAPFLLSLGAALLAYLVGGALERGTALVVGPSDAAATPADDVAGYGRHAAARR
jgi:Na+/proline symporter